MYTQVKTVPIICVMMPAISFISDIHDDQCTIAHKAKKIII
jgi:hypothetical protein